VLPSTHHLCELGHALRHLIDHVVLEPLREGRVGDSRWSNSSQPGSYPLGSPIHAALSLARVMVNAARPLRSGDVVLSGALGPMIPAKPGTAFEARIQGLGSVRVAFGS
jgi:hypothetical protein